MKNIILFIFIIFWLPTLVVSGQYFEFTGISDNGFQQGCDETYDIYFDTEGLTGITTAQTLVLFDDTKIDHVVGSNVLYLRNNLFDIYKSDPSGMIFDIPGFPQWKSNYNKVIFAGQNPDVVAVSGYHKFGSLKFKPKFDYTTADFVFIYGGQNETVLNDENGNQINSFYQNSHLTGTILVERAPCLYDIKAPSIVDNIYIDGSTKVLNNGLNIKFEELENEGDVPYVRTGLVWTGNTFGITNQYGINSGSVVISVAGNGQTRLFHYGDFFWNPINAKTREYKDRDYNITTGSSALFNFGIEQPIAITYRISDRVGNVKTNIIHFNNPHNAFVTDIYPLNNQSYVIVDDNVSFKISDDWAGVDSVSVVLTLSGIDNSFFGVYSGTDLNFSGVSGIANHPDYDVVLSSHVDFPVSGDISASIYGTDLEGNGGVLANWHFTTVPNCVDLGCCDDVVISGKSFNFIYPNINLYISGGINAYLTGIGSLTGMIDCNTSDQGLSIYRGNGQNNTGVFVGFTDLNSLKFQGTRVKAVLSGDTIFLTRLPSGGGGHRLVKDNCPDGDMSSSYYDNTCAGGMHGGADICNVDASNYSNELKGAYLYSYAYKITTMCPVINANLDGYLQRNHFAKMISEFAVNVLGKKPGKPKEGCASFIDIEKDTQELKGYIRMACELELMGLHADGITPKSSFNPSAYVTRAEFGTVFSRLLFGNEYNVKKGLNMTQDKGYWYKKHLEMLKENRIMTKIDGNWPDKLEKRGYVMLMMQRSDIYGIFAGKIPSLNGAKALFD